MFRRHFLRPGVVPQDAGKSLFRIPQLLLWHPRHHCAGNAIRQFFSCCKYSRGHVACGRRRRDRCPARSCIIRQRLRRSARWLHWHAHRQGPWPCSRCPARCRLSFDLAWNHMHIVEVDNRRCGSPTWRGEFIQFDLAWVRVHMLAAPSTFLALTASLKSLFFALFSQPLYAHVSTESTEAKSEDCNKGEKHPWGEVWHGHFLGPSGEKPPSKCCW